MTDYAASLEVTVEELQAKLASSVSLTWEQDPKHKQTILLMTGPNTWIAKLKYRKFGSDRYRWTGKVAVNFQYLTVYSTTKEDAIKQIEDALRA
jgi:hypothetical protein